MNTRTNKTILLITLMICLATAVYSAVGTFTFRTSGASDTTEVVDLQYPQKVPEDASVTTDSIADGSITNAKLAEPVSVANGGTGKTTAAAGLAALGGASLNGSPTINFSAASIRQDAKESLLFGTSNFVNSMSWIPPASSAKIIFTRGVTDSGNMTTKVKVSGTGATITSLFTKEVTFLHYWENNGTLRVGATNVVNVGTLAASVTVALTASGVSDLHLTIGNVAAENVEPSIIETSFAGRRFIKFTNVGVTP
jgi:hypothetical protein